MCNLTMCELRLSKVRNKDDYEDLSIGLFVPHPHLD